jgi:hypothetical protein
MKYRIRLSIIFLSNIAQPLFMMAILFDNFPASTTFSDRFDGGAKPVGGERQHPEVPHG